MTDNAKADTTRQFSAQIEQLVALALAEDIGTGDITSSACIPENAEASALIISREPLNVCGQNIVAHVFEHVDSKLCYQPRVADGLRVSTGAVLAELKGPLRSILQGERTALNFLQRLSGICTTTARIVDSVSEFGIKVLDTRKTTPGWRELEKYAVAQGGGTNHRYGLFDAVLIKNNHLDALNGDISAAIEACRQSAPTGTKVEIEVRDTDELLLAVSAAPDAILLDNMSPEELRQAVSLVRSEPGGHNIELEASGGISESNIRLYADTGVDSISLGMLTHSVKASDISLRFNQQY